MDGWQRAAAALGIPQCSVWDPSAQPRNSIHGRCHLQQDEEHRTMPDAEKVEVFFSGVMVECNACHLHVCPFVQCMYVL